MIRLAILMTWLGTALLAQDYPALHLVVGVAADDVLNIRERPDASSPVLATLAPDAEGIEVLEVVDGWATVNAGDSSGYVAFRYLQREAGPEWNALERPLICLGTEPFWSLDIDPDAGHATLRNPVDAEHLLSIGQTWPGAPWASAAALSLPDGIAVLYPAECSDGMSDRRYGIAADLFLTGPGEARLSGCCLLTLP